MNRLACISALLLFGPWLRADDQPAEDPDLPQPLDLSFAETLVTDSPFTRSVNLEDSLQLTGIAYFDGRPVATVVNKETKARYVVTEEPNAQGWKLTGAVAGADLSNSEIEMMVGPEIITMHYGGAQLSPGADSKGGSASRLAASGSGRKTGDKFRASSYLGEHGGELYATLSPEGRDKFKELLKSHIEKQPEMTKEQSSAYAQKVFARIKETDHPSSGGSKSPKTGKPNKKKQGA